MSTFNIRTRGTALKIKRPDIGIVGCRALNSTPMYSSLKAGRIIEVEEIETIDDGITRNVEPGSITFEIASNVINVTDLVPEQNIKSALRLIAQTDRWMAEGAAVVAVASRC